jgi:ABC-type nitrate/sulfonate/bicarbonate transport system permease component
MTRNHAAPADRDRADRALGAVAAHRHHPGAVPAVAVLDARRLERGGEYGHALAVTLYEVAISMLFACGGGILLGASSAACRARAS